ncbi:DUF3040 domain-containing protein [Streptomyces sp. P9(2023)]|uniref:DUF3040 domain-containing protein n=1 Tax=Streptomyces sp. P9(2023) TaxID=3064394 RepID=UPI0028F416B9|nr:DUF3040 domain-containing protein [Streptomyces sp. P9(2023)]MDT9686997.1 DUF3040 domain-containing protein [Streptomyces sp. P9(2023)]
MSHPADDQRILAEMEDALALDDPTLVAAIDNLNRQFPEESPLPTNTAAPRHSRRVVVAVVLAIIALVALLITVALNSSSPPTGEEGVYPAALTVATVPFAR